jgi:prepilin-type N-terminal cleavage/methylation domain-containing protein/prepilin-type processing-associated H-X9-DG protein
LDLENGNMTRTRPVRGFTLMELLIVIAMIAVLLTLCLPAVQHARDEARKTQCQNHLKQMGLALHNYHDATKTFPPGWTQYHPQPGTETRFGWAVFISPYLDQAPLYKQLDFQTQRPEPLNLFQTRIAVYRCPEDPTDDLNSQRGGFGTMNYSGNFGPVAPPRWLHNGLTEFWPGQAATLAETNGLFFLNSAVRLRDITDGTANTILLGERSAQGGAAIWMGVRGNEFETDQVTDCSPGHEINSGGDGFSSRHQGGANFLFCDGRVVFLSEKIASGFDANGRRQPYQLLSHRSDGEVIVDFENQR